MNKSRKESQDTPSDRKRCLAGNQEVEERGETGGWLWEGEGDIFASGKDYNILPTQDEPGGSLVMEVED